MYLRTSLSVNVLRMLVQHLQNHERRQTTKLNLMTVIHRRQNHEIRPSHELGHDHASADSTIALRKALYCRNGTVPVPPDEALESCSERDRQKKLYCVSLQKID